MVAGPMVPMGHSNLFFRTGIPGRIKKHHHPCQRLHHHHCPSRQSVPQPSSPSTSEQGMANYPEAPSSAPPPTCHRASEQGMANNAKAHCPTKSNSTSTS